MYRVWIHSFNVALSALNLLFIGLSVQILSDDKIHIFFPRGPYNEPSFVWLFISVSLQISILISGSIAVVICNRWLIYGYWIATGILLLADTGTGLFWVSRFHDIFVNLHPQLAITVRLAWLGGNVKLMNSWNDIQTDLKCCGAINYTDYQNLFQIPGESLTHKSLYYLPQSCCETYNSTERTFQSSIMNFAHFNSTCLSGSDSLFQRGCSYLALKWLHRQADVLFILGYCIIFLLKSIFVVILRKELGELMKEIQHARTNRHNLVGTMYSTPCHGAESFKPKVETTYGLHSNNFRSINELITEIPLVHLRQSSSRRANAI